MAEAATHTEHVEHAGGHGDGEFPPFNATTYPGQLLWLAITFGFLYYMMAKVVVPRMTAILETRRSAIAKDLDEASRARSEAEEAGKAYEASLAQARASAQTIAQETRASLGAESDARRKSLEADLAGKLAASEATIAQKTSEAMGNVRGIAADAASAIVERLTGRVPDAADIHAALNKIRT